MAVGLLCYVRIGLKKTKISKKTIKSSIFQFVHAWDLSFVCFVCLRYSFLRSKMPVKNILWHECERFESYILLLSVLNFLYVNGWIEFPET